MANTIPVYNLKAVILETGLNPATLRAWERRYGLLKPQRSPGGHRLYSGQDIALLKWLMARQAEGLSISRAIQLWHNREESRSQERQPHSPAVSAEGPKLDEVRQQWIATCLAFDEPKAERTLSEAFAMMAPEVICTEVLQKGLAEIGSGWLAGTVSVQQEHFASALALRRLNTLCSAAATATRPERLLAACPPGEAHDFVLLLVTFLLRRRGWEVVYLGATVPLSHLDMTLRATSPRLLLATAQTLSGAASLRAMADYAAFRGVPLAYGGGVFSHLPTLVQRISGYFLGNELMAVPQMVGNLLAALPPLPPALPISADYTETLAKFIEKQGLITSAVVAAVQEEQAFLAQIEEANTQITQCIASALALGDIHYVRPSVAWLDRLLEDDGQSPVLAARYFAAYRQAVEDHLGDRAGLIVAGLNHLQPAD